MGYRAIYTCDKCEAEVDHPKEQLWNIKLQYQCEPSKCDDGRFVPVTTQWCRSCMEKHGFFKMPKEKLKQQPNFEEPTLEDRILELVNDALNERGIGL